jgi:ketosteroid isomerase-like protein
LVLSLACAAETADDDDGASLEEQSAAFRAVLATHQANYERWESGGMTDSVLAMYADDAVAAFGNQPVLRGKEALRANAGQMRGMGTPTIDLRTESATANGDLGVELGSYTFNMTLAAGAPAAMAAMFPDSGSYLAHWHRINGEWKIKELVVNSMKPLPGMEAMMGAPPANRQ